MSLKSIMISGEMLSWSLQQYTSLTCVTMFPGLHAEGIYRIPGNKIQVDLLTTKYNEGK